MSNSPKYFASLAEDDLRRILPFRAIGDVRYYLEGIRIEPCEDGGVRMIATNGHMLAVVRSQASSAEGEFTLKVGPKLAKEIGGSKASPGRSLRVVALDKPSELQSLSGEVEFIQPGPAQIDARYPEWRRVVPADDKLVPGITNAFDGKYIVQALELMLSKDSSETRRASGSCCTFHQTKDPTSPVVIRTVNMMAVVMPMRDDSLSLRRGAPEWLDLEPR